ncbi:hypothetical protein V494_03724 [Pseudogymnoascus sp. VKM F-4513 (FW-928)]|nr:hypothetical protein V494_03724 [Pseudogymnoascus sp. VKM F-4513 (FW-928)]
MYKLRRFYFASALRRFYTTEANYSAYERLNGMSQLPGIRGGSSGGEASFGIGSVEINTNAQKLLCQSELEHDNTETTSLDYVAKMAGREIPGYYFDAEKNKYFKIVADPAALYSKTAVRKRKADEAIAIETARVEKANRERVTRSKAAGKLDREIGRGDGRLDALWEFVGRWTRNIPVNSLQGSPRWRVFDVDVQSHHIVYSNGFETVCDRLPKPGLDPPHMSSNGVRLNGDANVNSITYSACKTAVLTTWLDPPRGPNVTVAGTSHFIVQQNAAGQKT